MNKQMLLDMYDELATDFYQTQLVISHLSIEEPEKVEKMGNQLLDLAEEIHKVRAALEHE